MNKFIKRILAFIFIIISIIIVDLSFQRMLLFKSNDLKLPNTIKTLILGHSHSAYAYDDKYIKNTINLSEQGEAYIYTYFKLKKIIESNPQIKNVFIEFTNNQIDKKDMNEWMWGDAQLQYRIKRYGLLLDKEAVFVLYKNNPTGFVNAFSKSLFDNLVRFFYSNKDIVIKGGLGKFTPSVKNYKTNTKYKQKKASQAIAVYNIIYLQKIVTYCKAKNIKVCLVRSPLHKNYQISLTEYKFKEILNTKFKNVKWLDNKDFPIPDSGFQDAEHLNSNGAKLYSQYFNNQIN